MKKKNFMPLSVNYYDNKFIKIELQKNCHAFTYTKEKQNLPHTKN